jgi:hypothetical protein
MGQQISPRYSLKIEKKSKEIHSEKQKNGNKYVWNGLKIKLDLPTAFCLAAGSRPLLLLLSSSSYLVILNNFRNTSTKVLTEQARYFYNKITIPLLGSQKAYESSGTR